MSEKDVTVVGNRDTDVFTVRFGRDDGYTMEDYVSVAQNNDFVQ